MNFSLFHLTGGPENSFGKSELNDNISLYFEIFLSTTQFPKRHSEHQDIAKAADLCTTPNERAPQAVAGGVLTLLVHTWEFPTLSLTLLFSPTPIFSSFSFPCCLCLLSLASDSCLAPVMTELKGQNAWLQRQGFRNAFCELGRREVGRQCILICALQVLFLQQEKKDFAEVVLEEPPFRKRYQRLKKYSCS